MYASGTPGVTFGDAGTAQFSVVINPATGNIVAKTGDNNGTVLATSSAVVAANTVHFLEIAVTFGASASYQVWLDSVSLFSGTGATKTTSNNTANQVYLGQFTQSSGTSDFSIIYDDYYLNDSTGSSPLNSVVLTNPRVDTEFATSSVQTQFTDNANIIGLNFPGSPLGP